MAKRDNRVVMKDVAARTGVLVATVSRELAGRQQIVALLLKRLANPERIPQHRILAATIRTAPTIGTVYKPSSFKSD